MTRASLLFIFFFSFCVLNAQQSALINADWELRVIYNTQSNKRTFVDESCRSTLFFSADSTYRGRGCCNAVIPVYNDLNEVPVKVSRYTLKGENGLIMTKPFHKTRACLSTNTEELIFVSWAATTHYSIKADTLILHGTNTTDLFYVKVK